jgi:ribonuclease BN (tRNA processing enzyme)
MDRTTITVIGTTGVAPAAGEDSACLVINAKIMVDTGYYAAQKMKSYGLMPGSIDYLCITHVHPDHAIGLPQLLSERAAAPFVMNGMDAMPPLTVIGPAGDIEILAAGTDSFRSAMRGLSEPQRSDEYSVVPLGNDDAFDVDEFALKARLIPHDPKLKSLAYRFTDKRTGSVIVFTGDTGFNPDLASFSSGADLLVHDCGNGSGTAGRGHSMPTEAATVALNAGVARLLLIHHSRRRAGEMVAEAQKIFPRTVAAEAGVTITL